MDELGFASDSEVNKNGFEMFIDLENETPYEADKANPYGIYKVEYERNGKRLKVTIYGVVRYNETIPEGNLVTHTLYAALEDPFGNVSDPGTGLEVRAENTRPQYLSGTYGEYSSGGGTTSYRGLTAEFNTLVMVDRSIATDRPSKYSKTKVSELPVFGDGTYDISFYDIFGTKWTQRITLTDVFRGYSLRVSLSETGDTSGPVTVTITADHPDTTYFSVYESTGIKWEELSGQDTIAEFDITANSEMHIILYNKDDGVIRVDEMFYITNIVTGSPAATVQWYYSEFKSDSPPDGVTSTSGTVTAWYTADREVSPIGGTSESYTFYPGDGITSYTFRFTDKAGNEGSVTATLPIALAEPAQVPNDDIAPEYDINIYGMNDGIYYPVSYYSSISSTDTLSEVISSAGYVQAYRFNIGITDDSPSKMILLSGYVTDMTGISYDTSTSDSIDGVVLSGRTITVSEDTEFTVVIMDKYDNCCYFFMDIGTYLDTTAPTAEVNKVNTTFYTVRTYINLGDKSNADDDTGNVTVLSPTGLPLVTE